MLGIYAVFITYLGFYICIIRDILDEKRKKDPIYLLAFEVLP